MRDLNELPNGEPSQAGSSTERREWVTPEFKDIELKSALGTLGSPAEGGSAN